MTRLDPRPSEVIDRRHPVRFTWNGNSLSGYQGDTIASALLAFLGTCSNGLQRNVVACFLQTLVEDESIALGFDPHPQTSTASDPKHHTESD